MVLTVALALVRVVVRRLRRPRWLDFGGVVVAVTFVIVRGLRNGVTVTGSGLGLVRDL